MTIQSDKTKWGHKLMIQTIHLISQMYEKIMTQIDIKSWWYKVMTQRDDTKQTLMNKLILHIHEKCDDTKCDTNWWHKVMTQSDYTKWGHMLMTQRDKIRWWFKLMTQSDKKVMTKSDDT